MARCSNAIPSLLASVHDCYYHSVLQYAICALGLCHPLGLAHLAQASDIVLCIRLALLQVVAGRQVVLDWAMAKARFTDAAAQTPG